MSEITADDVRQVAKLARLELDDAEVEKYREQLGHILGYIGKLSEVDVSGVEPMAHVGDLTNAWRPDEPGPTLTVDQALQNAPDEQSPFFGVPKVLGEGPGA
ncbi:MAG: Asp-tRNA(Asn)/Glu-tRNA(Gln) amidotransferase subunit GatC [Planctomycetota bacterium]